MKLHQTKPARHLSHVLRSVETNGLRGTLAHMRRRVISALDRHGLVGTLQRTVREVPRPQAPETPHSFDLLHGTDTGVQVAGRAQGHTVPGFFNSTFANSYLGIAPSALVEAISQLPLKREDFTFVDLGCGKGRAVMIAAQFPFQQILGVEISPELCHIARANVARKPEWAAKISIFEQDAAAFTFPNTPLVIFLYHPFLPPLLRRVLSSLERQLRRHPRETWLLYADNKRGIRVLDRFPFLRQVSESNYPLLSEDQAAIASTHERIALYTADL